MKRLASIVAVLGLGLMLALWYGGSGEGPALPPQAPQGAALVVVTLPDLSGAAAEGATAVARHCADCHGADAGGRRGEGPPLVHALYVPGYQSDAALRRAIREGAPQRHWSFGAMPAMPGVAEAEIDAIIAFLRALQHANGVF